MATLDIPETMDEDILSDVVPSNIVSRQVRLVIGRTLHYSDV